MTVRKRLDHAFESLARAIVRHSHLTLALVLMAVASIASQLPNLYFDSSTEGFLREGDSTLLQYNEFRDQFGRDEMILIALRPERIFDLEFLELVREIHTRIEEEVPHLDEVTSLVNARATRGSEGELIVEDLMEEWPDSEEDLIAIETYARSSSSYRDMLLSRDGSITTIAIKTNSYSDVSDSEDFEAGFDSEVDDISDTESARVDQARTYLTNAENSEVVEGISEIVEDYRGRGVELMIAGSPVVMDEVKSSMQRNMLLFIRLTLLSIAVLLYILFRRVSAVAVPLVVVILTLVSTVGVMAAVGVPLKLPTMILPSFLLAVGIGDSVHILTLFYRAFDSGASKEDAIAGALEHSGLPVTLTSLTTAGGLLSFLPAELAPIADLGTFAPIGVMIAWALSLVLLPALLAALPVRTRTLRTEKPASTGTPGSHDILDRVLSRAASLSADRPWSIVAVGGIVLCASLGFAAQIQFSHRPLEWLPEDSPARIATERIDRDLRGSVTMELILTREGENAWYEPDALRRLERLSRKAEQHQSGEVFIGKAFSALDVLKEINRALNENREDYYRIPESRALIAQEFLLFENSGSDDLEDMVDSQFSKLRLTLKAPFVDAVAYARTIPEIQAMAEESLGADTQIEITGLMPLLFRTMTAVNVTMTRSYILAFIIITGLMMLMIGSVKLGLVAMIPNLLPIAMAMGMMGALGMPLDTFTLMIASISLGLAVDDTIHFMHNYRRYQLEYGDSRTAIQHTLATTGRAMLFTTLALASSFAIFMFSSMSNLFNFGALTSFAIASALLADILLAPALMHLIHREQR